MPFHAVVDGNDVISLDYTDEDWKALQKRNQKERCITFSCGNPGHTQKSRLKTKYFAHYPDCEKCGHAPESVDHVDLKARIHSEFKGFGYFPHLDDHFLNDANCKPDVYVEVDGRKIGIEVQLSKQTVELVEERNKKYLDAGYECYWLFGGKCGSILESTTITYRDMYKYTFGPEIRFYRHHGVVSAFVSGIKKIDYPVKIPAITGWVKQIISGEYIEGLKKSGEVYRLWEKSCDSDITRAWHSILIIYNQIEKCSTLEELEGMNKPHLDCHPDLYNYYIENHIHPVLKRKKLILTALVGIDKCTSLQDLQRLVEHGYRVFSNLDYTFPPNFSKEEISEYLMEPTWKKREILEDEAILLEKKLSDGRFGRTRSPQSMGHGIVEEVS